MAPRKALASPALNTPLIGMEATDGATEIGTSM
jgi:hypothetical protein